MATLKPTLTDKILITLAEIDDLTDMLPRSQYQALHWDLHKSRKRQSIENLKARLERKRVQKTIWRLKKASYLTIDTQNSQRYQLTAKGWFKILYWQTRFYKKNKIKSDNKFFITFDIPEPYRKMRELLRKSLYNLNYEKLQKSIFFTNDIKAFEFVQKIVAHTGIKEYVKFIIADKFF